MERLHRLVDGRLPFGEKEKAGPDLLTREPPEIPTPLPPNRPYGEEPSGLHDDDAGLEMHREQEAAAVLRDGMRRINAELGVVRNLTEAIDVVLPWRESIRVQTQPFERDFATLELTNGDASPYLCGETVATGDPQAYGTYLATLFRLKVRGGGGARPSLDEGERPLAYRRLRGVRAIALDLVRSRGAQYCFAHSPALSISSIVDWMIGIVARSLGRPARIFTARTSRSGSSRSERPSSSMTRLEGKSSS